MMEEKLDEGLAQSDDGVDQEEQASHVMEDMAIHRLSEKVKELNEANLRLHAELENLRRRSERERLDAAKYGLVKFVQDLLAVADGLELANQNKEGASLETLQQGMNMVQRELDNLLERNGIKKFQDLNEPFDPERHQALFEITDGDLPAGTVAQVIQSGYMIHDRLLRPARVGVKR